MNSSYGKIYGRPELGREEVGGLKPAALVWESKPLFGNATNNFFFF